jgi:hypothetical protein
MNSPVPPVLLDAAHRLQDKSATCSAISPQITTRVAVLLENHAVVFVMGVQRRISSTPMCADSHDFVENVRPLDGLLKSIWA